MAPANAACKPTWDSIPRVNCSTAPNVAKMPGSRSPFGSSRKEPQRLLLKVTRASDYGTYQAQLNGVKIGPPMDLYAPDVSEWEHHLLDFWPEPGDYTLRLECIGKNAASTGHLLGIESVRLRQRRPRVEQYAHETRQRLATAAHPA